MLPKITGNRIRLTSLSMLIGTMLARSPIAVAADSCVKPKCPSSEAQLNGETATPEQLVQARQFFMAFMDEAKNYQSCLSASGMPERFLTSKYDEMQNEMEHAAAVFNRELRRFKQRRDVAASAAAPAAMDLR